MPHKLGWILQGIDNKPMLGTNVKELTIYFGKLTNGTNKRRIT